MEAEDTLYFSWDGDPAVFSLNREAGFDEVFFIRGDSRDWAEGDGPLYAEIAINGDRLSKPDFESTFGIIGEDLPTLPTT